MAGQLAVDLFGYFTRAAKLAFDEGEHGDAFESRAALATPDDHFDRCERAGRWLGVVRLFPRDAAFFEELQHDVHVRALSAQFFHEIFENRLHERVVFRRDGVDRHVAKENRVGAHAQVMLHLALNDLLTRPTMLDDAVEPRVLLHRHFRGVSPKLISKLIERHQVRSNSVNRECPSPFPPT